jgi:hypothetical protein
MALGHAGVTLEALAAENLCAQKAVTDIRLFAEARNARSVAAEDADVVEHRRLFDKSAVDIELGMTVGRREGLVADEAGMRQQDVAQGGVVAAILIDE